MPHLGIHFYTGETPCNVSEQNSSLFESQGAITAISARLHAPTLSRVNYAAAKTSVPQISKSKAHAEGLGPPNNTRPTHI